MYTIVASKWMTVKSQKQASMLPQDLSSFRVLHRITLAHLQLHQDHLVPEVSYITLYFIQPFDNLRVEQKIPPAYAFRVYACAFFKCLSPGFRD